MLSLIQSPMAWFSRQVYPLLNVTLCSHAHGQLKSGRNSCRIFVIPIHASSMQDPLESKSPASSAPAAETVHPVHSKALSVRLNLETTRTSPATSPLEFAALGLDEGFLVLVGAHAEVLEGLTAVLGSTEDHGVAAGRGAQSQLVEGDGLAASSGDAGTGGSGEPKGGNADLGEGQETVVIGDSADDDDGSLLSLLVDVGRDARERDRRSVDLGHKQAAEHNLVEGSVGPAGQEAVQLYQELEVDIVALRGLPVGALGVVAVEIDTCMVKPSSAFDSSTLKAGLPVLQ